MADRTSAGIFGAVFHWIASQDEPINRRKLADFVWRAASDYDFAWSQMDADEALIELGLAKRADGFDVEYTGPGPEPTPQEQAMCDIEVPREGGES